MKAFAEFSFSLALLALCCVPVSADVVAFGAGGNQFSMEFATIGNPGNADDTTGLPNPVGAVDYTYAMGKFEVSRDMIAKASAAGGLGITMFDMTAFGGNGLDRPATGVTWTAAARFVNWLNTSEGFPAAYKFSAQPGEVGYNTITPNLLWAPGDPGFDAANVFRNSLAHYFLPSADEWYKAAYYDPTASGGAGGYRNFTTGSDTAPTAVASGTTPGTAVYNQPDSQGPADLTQAGGLSPYGVMGLGGNAYEMEETESDLTNDNSSVFRGVRGGSWENPLNPNFLSASLRAGVNVSEVNHVVGFRVTSITAAFLAADFDADHDVDGADLTRWRSNFGTGATHLQGNADGDLDADGADFLVWQRQFGSSSPASAASAAVPEPSTAMLLLLGYGAAGRFSSRGRGTAKFKKLTAKDAKSAKEMRGDLGTLISANLRSWGFISAD